MDLKTDLLTLLDKNGNISGPTRRSQKCIDIFEALEKKFPERDPLTSAFCVINGIEHKTCRHCGSFLSVLSCKKGYSSDFCNSSCRFEWMRANPKPKKENKKLSKEEIRQKIERTMLERYGVTHPSYSPELLEKKRQNNIKKFGVGCHLLRDEMKARSASAIREKQDSIREKIRDTCMERYGVSHSSKSETVKNKVKQTNLERRGVEWVMQDPEVLDKARQTNLERRGVEWVMQDPEVSKTGVEAHREIYLSNLSDFANKVLTDAKTLQETVNSIGTVATADACGVCVATIHRYMDFHGIDRQKQGPTKIENFVEAILVSNNIHYIKNDRKVLGGLEIDFLIPSHMLGIECNGLFYHSYNPMASVVGSNKRDYEKTELASTRGIKLLNFYEDDFKERPLIVKSMILNSLGLVRRKIDARKCTITSISATAARTFCETNHIKGYSNSAVKLGCFFDNELVSVMTFSKNRFNRDGSYEVVRFCSLLNTVVRGVGSKFIKHFIKEFGVSEISTYADLCYGDGKSYEKMGFTRIGKTAAGYCWLDGTTRISRQRCQHKNLQKWLPTYDPEKTEDENMFSSGYRKLYDCGHAKFILEIK